MAVLATTNPTLADVAAMLDPNGEIATIVEILKTSSNDVLSSLTFQEGNLPTGHQSSIRTGIPTPTWRKLYGGVQPTAGSVAKVVDSIGMLEDYAEVDKALADLNGNTAAFRLQEDTAHLQGMNDTMASTLFYGNEGITPEAFTGLSPRFNSLGAANGLNIIDAGGTGSDNTSIWLVSWSDDTIAGIYPKGSKAGIVHEEGDFTLDADMVIMALGFEPEDLPTLFGSPDLNVTRWGTIRADHVTGMTNLPGVFAVGDIVRGASLVVWAIKDGRDVVEHMHSWMQNNQSKEKKAA